LYKALTGTVNQRSWRFGITTGAGATLLRPPSSASESNTIASYPPLQMLNEALVESSLVANWTIQSSNRRILNLGKKTSWAAILYLGQLVHLLLLLGETGDVSQLHGGVDRPLATDVTSVGHTVMLLFGGNSKHKASIRHRVPHVSIEPCGQRRVPHVSMVLTKALRA